jgi:uncharacterized protein YjbJ (UPF0337 family)
VGVGAGQSARRFSINHRETHMNWDRIEGNWTQLKGNVIEQWGKLTHDDIEKIAGKRDQLRGKIQENYGISSEAAESQITDWQTRTQDVFAETAAEVKKHKVGLKGQ